MTGGKVILVGAGPGNTGLLTLRGKEALENADVVLYDRLVGDDILAFIPQTAEKVDVGKSAGNHPLPQHEINAMILRIAKEGKCVVRLKGGDPYLFGRGAEELESLHVENIPFEVVPGVTSAIAAPAFAGIPVSHRDFASSVHIITAHRKNSATPALDYESLIKLNGTLIFLMGLGALEEVMTGLTDAGMDPSTPAALIENGTRQNQRKLISTIERIAALARREGFISPSLIIVGEVCASSEKFDWFSKLPLHGVHIIVTRPKNESALSRKLRALGADVTDFPCIRTQPLPVSDEIFASLSQFGWIVFTSPVGAELFFEELKARGLDVRSLHNAKLAAVGAKTAAVVEKRGLFVDFIPEPYNAKALAEQLPNDEKTRRVLLFRAEAGTPMLAEALKTRGFQVDDTAAYRTVRESDCAKEVREALAHGVVDFVAFTSASTVQGFTDSLTGVDYSALAAACIGEETATEARKHGFRVLISEKATVDSMVECILASRSS